MRAGQAGHPASRGVAGRGLRGAMLVFTHGAIYSPTVVNNAAQRRQIYGASYLLLFVRLYRQNILLLSLSGPRFID